MFNSHTSLFPKSSEAWDTSCARKYLKISDEELKKLDPGWSSRKLQYNKNSVAEQGNSLLTGEGPRTTVLVNLESTVNTGNSIEKANVPDILVEKLVLPPRKKAKLTPSSVKEIVHSNPLQSNNKGDSSLTAVSSRTCISTTLPAIGNMSTAPSTLSQSNKSSVERSQLDTTYVVSSVLEDKTNDMEIISDNQSQATSSSQKVSSKKRTSEKLGTESSSLMLPEENVPKFGNHPVFATNPLSAQVGHGSFLNKKLRLLERRFSPSKDFSLTPTQEALMAQVNLSNVESQEDSVSMSGPNPNKVSSSQANIHSQTIVEISKKVDIPNSQKNITTDKAVGNELAKKEYAELASKKSKSNVFEEESFVSQPIPCGQPLPSNPSDSTIKSQVAQPPVANSIDERNNFPFCVLSEKRSSEVPVQEAVSLKTNKVGRKKKLKSKGESTSRRPDNTKSVVSVQYTAEQIRKMIEMLNQFHSAM